jgi:putative membrane protein
MSRLILLVPLLAAGVARGHGVDANGAGWSSDPWVLAPLALAAFFYARGLRALWRRAGRGRGVPLRHALAFAAGWGFAAAALLTPLDAWADRLFAAHMVQHELLMALAAPLLVLGRPLAVWAWAVPPAGRRALPAAVRLPGLQQVWSVLAAPLPAFVLHAAVVWAWHAPTLFEAALHSRAIHTLQHVTFLGSALLFWWNALAAESRVARGTAVILLFATMLHTGVLGALLTFSPTVWYPTYRETAGAFGLDPLADQQLGGLLMWVPGGASYVVAALFVAARWLGPVDARSA